MTVRSFGVTPAEKQRIARLLPPSLEVFFGLLRIKGNVADALHTIETADRICGECGRTN